MNILGLITARGGSKGIPGKNLAPLAGKPLLAYTCEAGLASSSLSRVVLSTDDPAIAEVGRRCGVEVPFLRPAALAADNSSSLDVALHALDWLKNNESWIPDALMILQPTSPLRTSRHINASVELLEKTGADTVVSVIPVPHRFSPFSVMKHSDGWLQHFWEEPMSFDRFRRQNQPVLFARNGPAVLLTRVPVLLGRKSFYGDRVAPYQMSEAESIDIDNPFDLRIAEAALSARSS